MKKMILKTALPLGLALATQYSVQGQHGHLNTGAVGKSQDAPLYFANAGDFIATSGYVKTLIHTNSGRFAGYYQGNITLTVLPATAAHAGPDPAAPALGAYIQASIVAVNGPVGGSFAFWESGSTAPTHSLESGQTGTNLWRLSESDGSSGTDPYGHIHGRRFTATKPGLYTVGFQVFDTSTNGTRNGPIHSPSEVFWITFQAGVHLELIRPQSTQTRVRFALPVGESWRLEAADRVTPGAEWLPVGGTLLGDDYFHEVPEEQPAGQRRFFRLKATGQ